MMDREQDVSGEVERVMDAAEEGGDETRLETLEEIQRSLESELDEGAETPPA